jgi:hypothetical protein
MVCFRPFSAPDGGSFFFTFFNQLENPRANFRTYDGFHVMSSESRVHPGISGKAFISQKTLSLLKIKTTTEITDEHGKKSTRQSFGGFVLVPDHQGRYSFKSIFTNGLPFLMKSGLPVKFLVSRGLSSWFRWKIFAFFVPFVVKKPLTTKEAKRGIQGRLSVVSLEVKSRMILKRASPRLAGYLVLDPLPYCGCIPPFLHPLT